MKSRIGRAARGTPLACGLVLALLLGCGNESPPSDAPTARGPATPAAPPAATPTPARDPLLPPNLVLITLDTTRADALGTYGQPWPTSPRIDRMASEGTVFEQVVSSSPETLPSHASLFTAKQPYSHGVRENAAYVLSESNRTLSEVLTEAGYRTAAEIAALVLRSDTQITQGFASHRDPSSPDVQLKEILISTKQGPEQQTRNIRVARDISDRAIEFISRHRGDPFLLWLHYFDVHGPQAAPASYRRRIPDSDYHAEVAHVDDQVGRVIDVIEQLGLRPHTLVVLTADHGEGLGEHGEPTHSFFVYDSTMRVPLVFWGLDVPEQRISSLVRLVDVAPTVLEMLEQPPLSDVQGTSLVPLIRGQRRDLGLVGYGEAVRFAVTFGLSPIRFVREGRWKYIHKVGPELYDLEADPNELDNRIEAEPEVAERLRAKLEDLLLEAPAAPSDSVTAVDPEVASQLAMLGYVGAAEAQERYAFDSLELTGADPHDKMADSRALSHLVGFTRSKNWKRAAPIAATLHENNPGNVYILGLHAEVLLELGRAEEAVAVLEPGVGGDPRDPVTGRLLARALEEVGRADEAANLLLKLNDRWPCHEPTLVGLKRLLFALQRYDEQVAALGRGARECPEITSNLNNYAWALATLPRDDLRDGDEAVRAARQALETLGRDDPGYLDTLAAALAEAGDFEQAERIGVRVVRELKAAGVPASVTAQVQTHLDAYRSGRAIRER